MGTSISHPSPRTTNWLAVAATYQDSEIPVERVVQELWRAAQSDAVANWASLLSTPIISTCLGIALASSTASEALRLAARAIAQSRQSSLAADIAKRAVVRSFSSEDRARGFAESLFAEASNYLVSRDLSGYIGERNRNHTVTDAITFKASVAANVVENVRQVPLPSIPTAGEGWQDFVNSAVRQLARRRK